MKKVGATARVQVTLDIMVKDTWGGECSVSQIYSQAAESALGIITRLNSEEDGRPKERLTVVGQPKVTAIFVEREN